MREIVGSASAHVCLLLAYFVRMGISVFYITYKFNSVVVLKCKYHVGKLIWQLT